MRCIIGTLLALPLAFLIAGCTTAPKDQPPVAPVQSVVDDFYGKKVPDAYRYMENLADPKVQQWIRGQADYAKRVLDAIPGRDPLLARIQELDAGAPYRIWVVRRWPNGDLHYLKRLASENLDKLYFRDARTGQERLLVDPEKMSEGKSSHYSLGFIVPSPNGRYVAYGVAAAGSEQTTLHILDSTTGVDVPETIDRMEDAYTPPQWLADSSGFVYSRRRKLPSDAPPTEGYKLTKSYLHRLGTDAESDRLVLAMNSSPAVGMLETDFPSIVLPRGSRWVIGQIKHGDSNEITLYSAPIESLSQPPDQIPWTKICGVEHEVEDYAVHGDDIYLLSARGAPRFKVMATSLVAPNFEAARTVIAEGPNVVHAIWATQDGLYIGLLDRGLMKIGRLAYGQDGANAEIIRLPDAEPSGQPISAEPDVDGLLLITSSWTRGGRVYAYEPATRALSDTGLRPRGKYDDVEGFVAREVEVASHDGVRVPLSIIHKSGIALDGSHPALVIGYGSYGIRMDVDFDPNRVAWLERGGVIAIAHVRGGGELGKQWHLAGQKTTKPNTWKDFIACCEYLIDQKYTSPGKLTGQGTSAGGILIGRAITERPDLFAAALVNVGCTDAIRMETTMNGVPNIQEFGSVVTRQGFEALYEMSAYAQVKDGTKYPAVLLTHGINDPRVEPWMSAKLTARLQAATSSGRPVLFRVDYDAGHGIGSTRTQRQQQLADMWAFLLWQTGDATHR